MSSAHKGILASRSLARMPRAHSTIVHKMEDHAEILIAPLVRVVDATIDLPRYRTRTQATDEFDSHKALRGAVTRRFETYQCHSKTLFHVLSWGSQHALLQQIHSVVTDRHVEHTYVSISELHLPDLHTSDTVHSCGLQY